MKNKSAKVSIVTVNHNGRHLLEDCFGSLRMLDYPKRDLQVIMIDNCSQDDSVEYVRKNHRWVTVIKHDSNNYCRANNIGIRKTNSEFVALLNNDTKVDKDWLTGLIRAMKYDRKAGIAGSKILFPDGRIQSVGHEEFPNYYWGDKGTMENDNMQYGSLRQVQSVSNCSALYRRRALEEVGLLDEDFNMYMEDVDIALRMEKRRWKVFYVPQSVVFHRMHGTGQDAREHRFYIQKNRLLILAKYFPEKLADMFFGNGEIMMLSALQLHDLLTAIFNKLTGLYGQKKGMHLFGMLKASVKKAQGYNKHCFNVEAEQKIAGFQRELSSKDQVLASQHEQISSKDQQLTDLNHKIAVKEKQLNSLNQQLNSLNQQLHVKNEQLASKDQVIASQHEQISSKDQQLASLTKSIIDEHEKFTALERRLHDNAEQLKLFRKIISTKDQENTRLGNEINARDAQLFRKDEELNALHGQIRSKNSEIAHQHQEIADIYNSDTYRFVVKPIVWPVFSFIKKVRDEFKKVFRLAHILKNRHPGKTNDICFSKFFAKNLQANYRQKNEYMITIFNRSFKDTNGLLVIDIWPYRNPGDPDRHYACFTLDVSMGHKKSLSVQMTYDWNDAFEFFADGQKRRIKHFMRGAISEDGLYRIVAYIADAESRVLASSEILQKLKK